MDFPKEIVHNFWRKIKKNKALGEFSTGLTEPTTVTIILLIIHKMDKIDISRENGKANQLQSFRYILKS